jgi:BlaI family transcriptional regulator, penicillinase repressor
MSKRAHELGGAELEVVKVLWDRGPSTVREVLEHLHSRGRRVAYTTVLTVLSRLEQKAVVASDKSGQAYVYKAKVSREKVTASRLKTLVAQLYDGAATPLVLQLMQTEKFSPQEIAQLQELIDRLDTGD